MIGKNTIRGGQTTPKIARLVGVRSFYAAFPRAAPWKSGEDRAGAPSRSPPGFDPTSLKFDSVLSLFAPGVHSAAAVFFRLPKSCVSHLEYSAEEPEKPLSRNLLDAAEEERKNFFDRLDGCLIRGLADPAQIIGYPITITSCRYHPNITAKHRYEPSSK